MTNDIVNENLKWSDYKYFAFLAQKLVTGR